VATTPAIPELLDRERELEAVETAFRESTAGNGRVLLVRGPPGSGKTSLLAAAESTVAEGCRVLTARGTELERDFAFGFLRQALERPVKELAKPERASVLSGSAAAAGQLLGFAETGRDGPSEIFRFVHAGYWVLANLAERNPLALLLDDVQWSDTESLTWLAYLAARVRELPVLMVLAVRSGDSDDGRELRDIARDAEILELPPFGQDATRKFIGRVFGDQASEKFVDACTSATGGNPFLLSQLLRALHADGIDPTDEFADQVLDVMPAEVEQHVGDRLDRLSAPARSLARAAAVFGSEIELRRATALAQLDATPAADAADELCAAELFRSANPLVFSHPLLQAATLSVIPAAHRAEMHLAAARILAGEGADTQAIAAQLTEGATHGDPWVVTQLREAATSAVEVGAARASVRYLRRALDEPPPPGLRGEVERELGTSEARCGFPDAIEHLSRSHVAAGNLGDRLAVARELALALVTYGRTADAVSLLERTVDAARPLDRELADLAESDLLGYAQFDLSQFGHVSRRFPGRQRLTRPTTPAGRLLAVHKAVAHALAGGTLAEAADLVEAALAEGQLLQDQTADAPTFYTAVHLLIDAERYEQAERALDEAEADARRRGSILGSAVVATQRASIAYQRAELDDAESEAWAAVAAARAAQWAVGLPITISDLVSVLIERGSLEAATEEIDRSGLGGDLPALLPFDWLLNARGRLHLARGDVDAGLRDLREGGERQLKAGFRGVRTNWRVHVAPVAAAQGDHEGALALARTEVEVADALGASRGRGMARRALGLALGGPAGINELESAAEILSTSPARLEYIRTLIELGAALRRDNQRSRAQEELVRAHELAHEAGAHALQTRAADELDALGIRTARRPSTGLAALTGSELRVARLAARGMSNPEIAPELYVTRKTVEKHLTSVYGKLAISSRDALAAALRR
jgi:DNA-binding CsgD family transcriptional regulator